MKKSGFKNKNSSPQIFLIPFFLTGIIFSIVLLYFTRFYPFSDKNTFWLFSYIFLFIANLIIYRFYRSAGLAADIFVIIAFIWWLYSGVGYTSRPYVFLPLIVALWISISYRIKWRYSFLFAWIIPFLWWMFSQDTIAFPERTSHYLVIVSSLLMLLVYAISLTIRPETNLKCVDFILCSYSGHTAHFTETFINGIKDSGTDVKIHRFHHYKSFKSSLTGDSLVISFPVFGCKPPWPFLYYLVFRLPKGKGKAAYILYTCIGGAENAGILCWLILTLKGYRPLGRNMAVYPINVPTFRLGTRKLWKFLDKLLPRTGEIESQYMYGRQFAEGKESGIPFIFALTPAFLAGILLDNKLLDTFLYRNHVMRKRCNQCGICIDYCPAERIILVDGYPKAHGTCIICMGCVNHCPHQAMHLWFWTEYGQQYQTRFKKFVVKKIQPK